MGRSHTSTRRPAVLTGVTNIVAALALASAFHAQAVEMRLDFSGTLTSSSAGFSDFIAGSTLSGYLLYDTTMMADYVDSYSASFDFWNSASPTLYIDQLNTGFEVSYIDAVLDGSYLTVFTFEQEITGLSGEYELGLDIWSWFPLFTYDDPGRLPTGIDPGGAPYAEGFLDIWHESGSEYSYFSLDFIEIYALDVVFPPPVLNEQGELLLGGAGLQTSAGIGPGDTLETTRTVVGYTATGNFEQAGGLHETAQLLVGGDSNNDFPANGSYTLTDGALVTGETQVGAYGTGEMTQTGGSHDAGVWLSLGNVGNEGALSGPRAVGVGTYNLEAGSLRADSATVGGFGQGTFNQSGGTHTVGIPVLQHHGHRTLVIGNGPSQYNPDDYSIPANEQRRGTYNLAGGDLVVYGTTVVGAGADHATWQYGGRGNFNQTGGTFFTQDLHIGEAGTTASGSGHYAMSGGSLQVGGDIRVGVASTDAPADASFVQTGGTVTVDDNNPFSGGTGSILIGEGAEGKSNAYRVLGGQTTATGGIQVGTGESGAGQAVLEVSSGGQVNADIFVLAGGVLTGSGGFITGDVTLDGGLFAPGSSPGTMSIDGSLNLLSGLFQLDHDGVSQDLLQVTGDVIFGADLMIELVLGFTPAGTLAIEDFFSPGADLLLLAGFDPLSNIGVSFLDGVNVSDGEIVSFSLAGETYEYAYSSEVPLPAAAWLLLSGLAGLTLAARRRRAA